MKRYFYIMGSTRAIACSRRRPRRRAYKASASRRYGQASRLWSPIGLFFIWFSFSIPADQIRLRSGVVIEGRVLDQMGDVYRFTTNDAVSVFSIPKDAVSYVLFSDAKPLNLEELKHSFQMSENSSEAQFMDANAFGQRLLTELKTAENSIWITAYFITGSKYEPIHSIYEAIKEKARGGLDVVVLCEFGPGTQPMVKNDTMNFAAELLEAGVNVLFVQENKVLHKKMVILDGKKVLLGSSNLTAAAVIGNNEMNVLIDDPQFVADACADFANLRSRAKTRDELSFQ